LIYSSYYLILIFLLWLIHYERSILFYVYFWQLKEYRWDRIGEEIRRNKKIWFSKKSALVFLSTLLVLFLKPHWLGLLVFVLFIIDLDFISSLFRKTIAKPKFTNKILLILGMSNLVLIGAFGGFCYSVFSQGNFIQLKQILLISILGLEIFCFFFVGAIIEIVQIPTSIVKRKIILRAKKKRESFKNLTVIGITGSYGKTSTKDFLFSILSHKYGEDKVLRTKENTNTRMGIAYTVLNELNSRHLFFICEIGAYRLKEIQESCQVAKPKIGILTGINEQHLALFGSLENIIQGKYELIKALSPVDGIAIFNGANQNVYQLYKQTQKIKRFYTSVSPKDEKADLRANNIQGDKEKIKCNIENKKGETIDVEFRSMGEGNVENFLLASLAAQQLGINLKTIREAASSFDIKGPKIITKNKITFLLSTYSANPTGALADMKHLQYWKGRKIIIMPCLIELGKASKKVHYQIGKAIAEIADLAIITKKEYFSDIIAGSKEIKTSKTKICFLENPQKIKKTVYAFAKAGDVVLLEGRLSKPIIDQLL
jgi:UDP-N-acetylmuramoyl-tripeptide--D-alanyl-D-alanine ligase